MRIHTIIYLLALQLMFGCSSFKSLMIDTGENIKDIAIQNAILDFTTSCNLYKKDSLFYISFEDTLYNQELKMMKFSIYILLFIIGQVVPSQGCNKKNYVELTMECDSIPVSNDLLMQIDSIKIKENITNKTLFYTLYFYKENQKMLLDVWYDFSPPLLLSKDKCIGYVLYKNDYLFVINALSENYIKDFIYCVKDFKTDYKSLEKMYDASNDYIDGFLYRFELDIDNKLNFIGKYQM